MNIIDYAINRKLFGGSGGSSGGSSGGGDKTSILGRKIEFGSFVPAENMKGFLLTHTLGEVPAGCFWWTCGDILTDTSANAEGIGAYMSDFNETTKTLTWGVSAHGYEASESDTKLSYAGSIQTPTAGSISYPTSTQGTAKIVFSQASAQKTKLGSGVFYFIAGVEYQYILFGGVNE